MTIQVAAYRWVPPFAQGYVRDLRIRWALEEAGMAYEEVLIDMSQTGSEAFRRWQPFGQIPAYRDDEVEMFESGAVVLHLAAKSDALAPCDAAGRARVTTWVIAALNSIEPHAQNLIHLGGSLGDEARARLAELVDNRLGALAAWLGDKDYLEGRFSAGDLMMATVLRELVDSGVLARFPTLAAYRARCEARPAFGRAMAAQMRPFGAHAPG